MCIHSVVHHNYVVVPVALGSGQFCTLAVERTASVFELFLMLESVCRAPKALRHMMLKGWVTCVINGIEADDAFAKDAMLVADSVRIIKAPEIDPGLAPERLTPLQPHSSTREGCFTLHSPGRPPRHWYASPYATPSDVHNSLLTDGVMHSAELALPLDLSPVQGSNGAHFLALEPTHLQQSRAWTVYDLRRVTHPPLVTFWAAPRLARISLEAVTNLLLSEFPSLDAIISVYSSVMHVEDHMPTSEAQAILTTVVGAPQDSLRTGRPPEPAVFTTTDSLLLRPGFLTSALRLARARRRICTSTTTTTVPSQCENSGIATRNIALPTADMVESDARQRHLGDMLDCDARPRSAPAAAQASANSGLPIAIFDVVHNVHLRTASHSADQATAVLEVLASIDYLVPPVAFRIVTDTLPGLPNLQVAVWTEPAPGQHILPIKTGDGYMDVCTISHPLDATPHEAAIHVALKCTGHDRLQYHVASRNMALQIAGSLTAPFVAWQLAAADSAILVRPSRASSSVPTVPTFPAETIAPAQISESRFASRHSEISVHRLGRPTASVRAGEHMAPQQLLEHIMHVCGLRGSMRLSFPAIMPAVDPCRLHVVLHPKGGPLEHHIPCLLDLRRVTASPSEPWCVVLMPPVCTLADVQRLMLEQFTGIQPYSAAYLNYQRLRDSPLGLHRHSVITLLGMRPSDGLDVVNSNGSFGPLCYRGSDVAATRSGLAQFLAFPAVGPFSSTSTTTTSTTPSGSVPEGADSMVDEPILDICTVFDTEHGYQMLPFPASLDHAHLPRQICSLINAPDSANLRLMESEIICLPSPQFILTTEGVAGRRRAVVFDLTPFGGDISVAAITPGQTLFDVLEARLVPSAPHILEQLQSAQCVCLVNHIVAAPSAPLGRNADVVHFYLLRNAARTDELPGPTAAPTTEPASGGVVHPASNPISFGPAHLAVASPDPPQSRALSPSSELQFESDSSTLPVGSGASSRDVVQLQDWEGRYTVIGTIEGAINRHREFFWDPAHCVADAVTTAPRDGPYLQGRALRNPLPELFVPQVLISRADESLGRLTIAVDLRPLRLGVTATVTYLGATLSRLLESGSPLADALHDMGRLNEPLRFRLNSQPAFYNTAIAADSETVTIEPDTQQSIGSVTLRTVRAGAQPDWSVLAQDSGSADDMLDGMETQDSSRQLIRHTASQPAHGLVVPDAAPAPPYLPFGDGRCSEHEHDNSPANASSAPSTAHRLLHCLLQEVETAVLTTTSSTTQSPLCLPVHTPSTTTTSTAPSQAGRPLVLLACSVPGDRPRCVRISKGEHVCQALWDILQAPGRVLPAAPVWTLATCPRTFSSKESGRLVLTTFVSEDPFWCNVWIDLRTHPASLFTASVELDCPTTALVTRFCPDQRDMLVYMDGALAGDTPTLRNGCVLTICPTPQDGQTEPLSHLFGHHPSLQVLRFPLRIPRCILELERARQAAAHWAVPIAYSSFRREFFFRLSLEVQRRADTVGIAPHQAIIAICCPEFGVCKTTVGSRVAPTASQLRPFLREVWPELLDYHIFDTGEFFGDATYYVLGHPHSPMVAWLQVGGEHDDVLFLPPGIHPEHGIPCPSGQHPHVYRCEGAWGLYGMRAGAPTTRGTATGSSASLARPVWNTAQTDVLADNSSEESLFRSPVCGDSPTEEAGAAGIAHHSTEGAPQTTTDNGGEPSEAAEAHLTGNESCTDDSDASSFLQHRAHLRQTLKGTHALSSAKWHEDTSNIGVAMNPGPTCPTGDSEHADITVWALDTPPKLLRLPVSATAAEADAALSSLLGRSLLSSCLLPIYPPCQDRLHCALAQNLDLSSNCLVFVTADGSHVRKLLHVPLPCTAGSLAQLFGHGPGSFTLSSVPWSGSADGMYHGMHLFFEATAHADADKVCRMRKVPTPCRMRSAPPRQVLSTVAETTPPAAPVLNRASSFSPPQDGVRGVADAPPVLALDEHVPPAVVPCRPMSFNSSLDSMLTLLSDMSLDAFCKDFHRIPSPHLATTQALKSTETWTSDCPIDEVCFYTDGSYSHKNDTGGWAVVALVCSRGHWLWAGFMSGHLAMPHLPEALGYDCISPHSAELVALLHALCAASALQGIHCHIRYDAQAAAAIADCTAAPTKHITLAKGLASLRHIATLQCLSLTMEHVSAHQGHAWNEAADSIAKAAASQVFSCCPSGHHLATCLRDGTLHWLWWTVDPRCLCGELPPLAEDGSPLAIAPVRERTHPLTSVPGVPRAILTHGLEDGHQGSLQLNIATYNCTTVSRQHDREWLTRCFAKDGLHVIGIQESRTDPGLRFRQDDYLCLCGPCQQGNLGCQIWLNTTIPISNTGEAAAFFEPSSVTFICRHPRLLAISVMVGRKLFCVLSGHAPHAAAACQEKDEWWNLLDTTFRRLPRNAIPVLCIDANARVLANAPSTAREAPPDGDNAERFATFLTEHSLQTSSTHNHKGRPVVSWVSPAGKPALLDYVAFPQELQSCSVTWGCPSHFVDPLGFDHTPVMLSLAWQDLVQPTRAAPGLDTKAMATAEGKSAINRILATCPSPHWTVHPDDHLQMINDHVYAALQNAFPMSRCAPAKRHISDELWAAVRERRHCRRLIFYNKVTWHKHLSELIFNAWKAARKEFRASATHAAAVATANWPRRCRSLRMANARLALVVRRLHQ